MNIQISLIMATIGERIKEFLRFWEAVSTGHYAGFELIIVDQTGKLQAAVESIKDERIKYYRVNFIGLSLARNFGLQLARGEIVSFPDDDCWFPKDALKKVAENFGERQADGIIGRIFDPILQKSVNRASWPKANFIYSIKNIWIGTSYAMFFKKSAVTALNGFDENFGIGARYGACEESDLLFRLIQNRYTIVYINDLVIYHPFFNLSYSKTRAYTYGLGFGAFTRKCLACDRLYYMLAFFLKKNLAAVLKTIFYFPFDGVKSAYYFNHLKGLLSGFINFDTKFA